MLKFCFRLLALLPLSLVHAAGALLGWIIYLCAPASAQLMKENLHQSRLCKDKHTFRQTLRRNIAESGKGLLETFAIWSMDEAKLPGLVLECKGWEHVDNALNRGKGIIFLTPHQGCFEITSLYYASRHPITVLYRPPKSSWLMPFIRTGRERANVKLAPANLQGVRSLIKALKRGEAIGILPDQIPAKGEGEWAPFFGRPAYTMTLASKLAESSGAAVIMAFGERLEKGKGYVIHLTVLEEHAIATPEMLNRALEKQIAQCPEQYLWNYHRYKIRRKAKPFGSGTTNE